MATIKDVARLAGVSTTTVSHVINKTRFVAEATTKKVWESIEELNYAPSAVARSLKSNVTRSLGILVTDSSNAFFSEVIHSIESYSYNLGYTITLCNTGDSKEKYKNHIQMLSEKRVDGILVMCSEVDNELINYLKKFSIPLVIMDWANSMINFNKIQDNSDEGGFLATQYLINKGHKKIGCLTGGIDKHISNQRFLGYKKAMLESGLEIKDEWIFHGNFEFDSGISTAQIINEMPQKPTAIFCFNDAMAMALISKLTDLEFLIPKEFSIIGYDDIVYAKYYNPPLTTIAQPKSELGVKAIELLINKVQEKETSEAGTIHIYPKLIERKSVISLE